MGAKSSIQWTDASWTPIRARVKPDAGAIAKSKGYASLVRIADKMAGHVGPHCERVSAGCGDSRGGGCYSEANNSRCLPSNGTGLPFDRRARDLVDVFVDDKILKQPLHWKKPRRVFVCSQTDLFGEWNSDELIDRVFAVMALCPQHQFQVLSKRPERMLEYIGAEASDWIGRAVAIKTVASWIPGYARLCEKADFMPIPYRNIWLGISCEDQTTADERATILRQVPAAIRFISQEPQLDNIEWTPESLAGISWLVQGGESGPGSRPFYLKWARSTMDQCKAAGVSYFLKQLGAKPIDTDPKHWQHRMRIGDGNAEYNRYIRVPLRDRKGGDMSEWPEDLRVRQFPA